MSDKIPNTRSNVHGISSFEVDNITYLAFANYNQKNEVWKWEGSGFINISSLIPNTTNLSH
jgi:hypothetical protein